jgi:hypothetical protein
MHKGDRDDDDDDDANSSNNMGDWNHLKIIEE